MPRSAREKWLKSATGDDTELFDEVSELVARGESHDPLLAAPLLVSHREEAKIQPGTMIGGFKVIREIGQGGMGTVFEAQQTVPARRVALKILPSSFSSRYRDRFRYEIDALGILRHPCIAQVYEAGELKGSPLLGTVPWYAMELVREALPIVQYADAKKLDRPARFALFASACAAVQHGHLRGIVHRDLKPENMLVDRRGQLKIIDFGIAQAVDDKRREHHAHTLPSEIVGTLGYMSPEQARGEATDTRSDVYSLGVVLFELCTRERPFELKGMPPLTALTHIATSPARRAATVDTSLRGDLDAILAKALASDPDDRYASPQALATDLHRHLHREPIHARTPSTWRSLRLFAARNRLLCFAIGAVCAVSIAAALISLGFAQQSRRDAERASSEQARFQSLFESQFQQSITQVAYARQRLEHLIGGAPIADELVRGAISQLEALEKLSRNDVRITEALVPAYEQLASSTATGGLALRGEGTASIDALKHALWLTDELVLAQGASENQRVTQIRILARLIAMNVRYGNDPESFVDRLQDLVRDGDPPQLRRRASMALAMACAHDPSRSRKLYTTAIKAHLAVGDQWNAGFCYNDRGLLAERMRDFPSALQDYEEAHRILAEHADKSVLTSATAITALLNAGHVSLALDSPDRARKFYQTGVEMARELHRSAPRSVFALETLANAIERVGQMRVYDAMRLPKNNPKRRALFESAITFWQEALSHLKPLAIEERSRPNTKATADRIHRATHIIKGVLGTRSSSHGTPPGDK